MVKRCCYGLCKTDNRYPERIVGVYFIPFPKKVSNEAKCREWIKACGRPHHQLNVDRITKDTYICSKHFVGGYGPTPENPNPVPCGGTCTTVAHSRRSTHKKDILNTLNEPASKRRKTISYSNQQCETLSRPMYPPVSGDDEMLQNQQSVNTKATQTEVPWTDPLDVLQLTAERDMLITELQKLISENKALQHPSRVEV